MVGLLGTSPTPLGSTLSPRTPTPKHHGIGHPLSVLKAFVARLATRLAKPAKPLPSEANQVILSAPLPEMRQHILTAVADVEDHIRKTKRHHR